MLKYLPIIILFSSCVTSNKVKRFMLLHPDKAAEYCLEQFPQESKSDTIRVVKDSLIVDKSIDTLYKWITDTKYVDQPVFKEKIKQIVKASHDTIIINTTKWDDRYKVLYEKKSKDYIILEEKHAKKSKALFWTWLWIGLVGVGYMAYKRYL